MAATTNLMSLNTQPINSSNSSSARTSTIQRPNKQNYRNYQSNNKNFEKVFDKVNDSANSSMKSVDDIYQDAVQENGDPITAAITTSSAQGKSNNTQDAPQKQSESQPTEKINEGVSEIEDTEEPSTSKTVTAINLFSFVSMNVEEVPNTPLDLNSSKENPVNLMSILPQSQESSNKGQDMLNLLAGRTWNINQSNSEVKPADVQINQSNQPLVQNQLLVQNQPLMQNSQLPLMQQMNQQNQQQIIPQNQPVQENMNPVLMDIPVQKNFVEPNQNLNLDISKPFVENLNVDVATPKLEVMNGQNTAITEPTINTLENYSNSLNAENINLVQTQINPLNQQKVPVQNVNQNNLPLTEQSNNVALTEETVEAMPQFNFELNKLNPQQQVQPQQNQQNQPQVQISSSNLQNNNIEQVPQQIQSQTPVQNVDNSQQTPLKNQNVIESQTVNNPVQQQPQQNQLQQVSYQPVQQTQSQQVNNQPVQQQAQSQQVNYQPVQQSQPQQVNYQQVQQAQPQQVNYQPVQQVQQAQQQSIQIQSNQPAMQIENIEIPQVQAAVVENQNVIVNRQQSLGTDLTNVLFNTESEVDSSQIVTQPQQTPQQQSQNQQQQNWNFESKQPMSNVFQADEAAVSQSQASTENFSTQLGALVNNTNDSQQVNTPINSTEQPQPTARQDFNITGQIVEHAKMIRTAENTEMVIHLKPEHLGELTLRVSVAANGSVNASFHSENAQVRAAIENTLVQLKQELANQGLKVDSVQVYAGLSDGGMMNGKGQQAWQDRQNNNSRVGKINLNNVSEEDLAAGAETVAQTNDNSSATDGVDYRV